LHDPRLEFLTNEENVRKGDQQKTSTEDFYFGWREAQGLHAKCFPFAFDVAKKAERALQHELGNPTLQRDCSPAKSWRSISSSDLP